MNTPIQTDSIEEITQTEQIEQTEEVKETKEYPTELTIHVYDNKRNKLKSMDIKHIDYMEKEFRAKHIERLAKLECDTTTGVVFLDALTNLERVSDHALNVAQGVLNRK